MIEISSIAKGMSNNFLAATQVPSKEPDFVEVLIGGLQALDKEKVFDFPRNAGSVLPLTLRCTSSHADPLT
jgi:hypothetical protein